MTSIVLKERPWTVLTRFFQLSWGRGQECVLWCATCTHRTQQHYTFSRTPIVLTNTASMDLGLDWFGCLKRFSRSIIIINVVFPFFLQEFGSYSAKDCLKFDCSNYDLHRLRFLWKRFAFCILPVWRMVNVMFLAFYIFIQTYPKLKQPFGMGGVSLVWEHNFVQPLWSNGPTIFSRQYLLRPPCEFSIFRRARRAFFMGGKTRKQWLSTVEHLIEHLPTGTWLK